MRLLAAVLFIAWPLVSGAQSNPITNGGFEKLDAAYFPMDWSPVGQGVTVSREARSGQYALRIERALVSPMPAETGLNRAWSPGALEGGAMLSQKKGIVRAWYRVRSASPDATMNLVVIPMGASGVEDTGDMRVQRRIANDAAGDGEWHETKVAYDYTAREAVRWVHVGVRIINGPADLLIDDVELLTGDRAVLQIEKCHAYPDEECPDSRALLTATVANIGSGPSGRVSLVLELPQGMTADGPVALEPLTPGGASVARWKLRGAINRGMLRLHADDGDERETAALRLEARAELLSALAQPSVVAPGGSVKVTATVWNRGTAMAEGVSVRLRAVGSTSGLFPATIKPAALPPIPPGRRATATFVVRVAAKPGVEHVLECALATADAGAPAQTWPVRLTVTDALSSARTARVGVLRLRAGADRTLAQVMTSPGRSSVPLGVMPHLGKVVSRLPSGKTATIVARHSLPSASGLRTTTLRAVHRDSEGGRWTFQTDLTPLSPSAIRVTTVVSCSEPREILGFYGPTVLAGEGSTGAQRDEAIFPGLEWLADDEVSSGDLDIEAGHPDRPRYAPHPHKVTIPAMVVATRAGVTSMLWDVHDRWDASRDRPQPVFASPDRTEGAAAHRMGLMAPSSADGWPENDVAMAPAHGAAKEQRAYSLTPGRRLRLSAVIHVIPRVKLSSSYGALEGVAAWFDWFKAARPAPAPQGSDLAQVRWSMQAYMKSLWNGDETGWLPFIGGPAIWRKPSFDPSFAYDLLEASRLMPEDPMAAQWLERVAMVRGRSPVGTGDGLYFAEGDPLVALRGQAGPSAALIARQEPDGAYTFDADRRDQGVFAGYDFHELGPPGAVESGLIAANAYALLRAARITGDQGLYQAGVKSLRRIRDFRVPRAAQVWEVPVHTPDILAAADAVDAFIQAFRFSGDRQWLEDARRWAVAGLPFVYVWNAPGKLWMRYGSIPVFGATQMRGSWFGNLVQWNGLRYAAAILKLHEHDPARRWSGLTWRDIALGITRSAMYQQSLKPEILTLWPDAFHTITGVRAAWDFAPRQILKNVFALMGRSEEPVTTNLSGGSDRTVRISALGVVSAAVWRDRSLSFTVQHPPGMRGSVVVAGVTRPAAVWLGGRRIPFEQRAMRPDEACWRYDDMLKAAAVRIPSDARAEVRLEGLEPAEPKLAPSQATSLRFEFDQSDEGWAAEHDLESLSVGEGALQSVSVGGDPYLVRVNCRIAGDTVQSVSLRIRADGHGEGQLYWTTASSPEFAEERVALFSFPPDGEWHEVKISVGAHPQWRGQTITGLRIDPVNAPGVRFAIDWARGL